MWKDIWDMAVSSFEQFSVQKLYILFDDYFRDYDECNIGYEAYAHNYKTCSMIWMPEIINNKETVSWN